MPQRLAGDLRVDFPHIEFQGAEAEVIQKSIEAIEQAVKIVFIGMHSRKIEGDLMEFLYLRGWPLLGEQPCVFDPGLRSPTFRGPTARASGQVRRTPKS